LLICDDGKSQEIIDRFFRIGYFKIIGYNGFKVCDLKEEFVKPTILKFITLGHLPDRTHLDVRSLPEYQSAGVIDGAILIPLPELETRVAELKDKKNLVINCLSGARSKVAFSVLARHGIESKILAEDFKEFKNNGFNIIDYKG
jgi:hydroxyacylglutathione hydrolase